MALSLEGGIALYLHIPFCRTRCPYCDFNTYAGMERLIPEYLDALAAEMTGWGRILERPTVASLFLGGGTPSLLSPARLGGLVEAVGRAFAAAPGVEVTAEVNPDDVTAEGMAGFRVAGVNRVSMGVQSLDDGLLRVLGRRHDARRAMEALGLLRRAGFGSVNLDLMYGLPGQTLAQWQGTVEAVLSLGPEHISAYALTLEEGTPMAAQVAAGSLPAPDQDLAADMYQWTREALGGAGYRHYEISNWARPGFECRHNLTYWRDLPYLGVGPGAHSYLAGHRFSNVRSPVAYIRRVREWEPSVGGLAGAIGGAEGPVAEAEAIGPEMEMAETAILGLRLLEGLPLERFRERFGVGLLEVYGAVVEEVAALGLAEVADGPEGRRLRLTGRGLLLSNEVFWRFLRR